MNQEEIGNNSSFLQIKELKEKVRSLVSEVDLNRENAKFKHEKDFDNDLSSSVSSEECEEEFIDCSEIELRDETNWLSEENSYSESVSDICKLVYSDIDDDRPDITNIYQQLESTSVKESNAFNYHKPSIDSRTFTRPKKYTVRPPLTSVVGSGDDGRPKLQRRLTTTISPTPNLISKLEELSKNNNRPVSGNYGDVNWQDGSEEGMAEMKTSIVKSKRQSLPASLFDRLQELKKANNAFKIPKVVEPSLHNGKAQDYGQSAMLEDARKVSVALDLKNTQSSSRLSEIYRNTQDYYSDDNESFISLDEVSGFCDRLTLSTDQSTYSSIVKEMEQNEICLFHRTVNEDGLKFGSFEISAGGLPRTSDKSQSADEDGDLNRTYEIDEEKPDERGNGTFEVKRSQKPSRNHVMNATFDANRKSGLLDVILQSDVIKNLSPNNGVKKGNPSNITNNNYNNNLNNNNNNSRNNNNNNNNYNKMMTTTFEGNNLMNNTYDKLNGTLDQNELNALQKEKYSTKIFDSNYRKGETEAQRSPTRSINGKKDSDHSEDDCMSTTSDNSSRSIDSNSEAKTVEDFKNIAIQQSKKFSSTPIMEQRSKLEFEVVSPIRMEMGDGESQGISNPSSRGPSPRRISASLHQDGWQKYKMPNLRQSLKVPQRELKLKPALIRPTMNFKRPLSSSRTSSEPSVPQKVESCSSSVGTTALRPPAPTATPSLTNVRPTSRTSGIPRPPTRLKQPQIRVNFSKK